MTKKHLITTLSLLGIAVTFGGVFWWRSMPLKQAMGGAEVPVEESKKETSVVLASGASIYRTYSKTEFDRALKEGKIIYLEFYASWCPICRAQESDLIEGFKRLKREDIVGFRVNYKDGDTDSDEATLAEKYNIPTQHYKIILKKGAEVFRSGEVWDGDMVSAALFTL